MKTPRFLLAVCISLVLAFTFSCSSDSSDDPPPTPVQSSSSDDGGDSSSSGGGGSSSSGGGGSSSSSDGSSSSSSDVVVSSSSSVPVAQRTLTINIEPAAGGTVTRDPDKAAYDHGTEVIVTADAKEGYAFIGWWSGETQVGETAEYEIEMDGNKTLTVKFALIPPGSYSLEIHVNDAHGGTVHHSPSGAIHVSGTVVTVTAEPEVGYAFTGWSGDATGTANPVSITMEGNKTLTANFEQADNGTFTDPRDSKTYEWVRIRNVSGTAYNKIWMAKNLNYDADGSKCVGASGDSGTLVDDGGRCADYGRLYNWATAMDVCHEGWHLPSDAEWDALTTAVGGTGTGGRTGAGAKLKAIEGWNTGSGYIAGTNVSGFSALPGGGGSSSGDFGNVGDYGNWWSSIELNATLAYSRNMSYDDSNVHRNYNGKSSLFSVRCVLD